MTFIILYMSFNSPIGTRYKAPVLSKIWCQNSKIKHMRQLWIDLAIFQKQLGVEQITDEGIEEMKANIENINIDKINENEKKCKHDIVANIHTYGELCPSAKPFIHLGVTSNFINDNVDLILIKKSLNYIDDLLDKLFIALKDKSLFYITAPTVAYTHLQPAQLTTIGKRFTLWNSDIKIDIDQLKEIYKSLVFRGVKGTVGSEDSILKLFDNKSHLCDILNSKFCCKYGFEKLTICGQTYSRKYDVIIFQLLSSICQSIYKMMNDIRLLSSKFEMFEDFSSEQVGSSAMPYKTNPISCEKICSLCRYVINQEICMKQTYINQWLERTLDDSAIKRIIYPECFLLVEHIIKETTNIISTLFINISKISVDIMNHMPFIVSEEIIIEGVKLGYDRQEIHERLRVILINYKFSNSYITDNGNNNIFSIFKNDELLNNIIEKSNISTEPINYIGRCEEQICEFYTYND
jgi:adenylosuccinate lyase